MNMANLILALLIIVLHGYWIYKLVNYDWDNFEEDSEGDDFLKPYEWKDNMLGYILFLVFLAVFGLLYFTRDKSKDEEKINSFFNQHHWHLCIKVL